MKIIRNILLALVGLWILYIAYLYIFGKRETFLIPEGYEGALLIIANQKDGIEINRSHAVYDFTKSNIIKLKGDLVTGFSPWGYQNFYVVNSAGEKNKLKVIDKNRTEGNIESRQTYVWDNYFDIGGCEVKGYQKTYYEAFIVGKASSVDKALEEKQRLINEFVCRAKP
jgi:hypothetical protein